MTISRRMSANARIGAIALVAFAGSTAHATTDTIVQNRDEPVRNAYQGTSKCAAIAGQPNACSARFPIPPKTDRVVIQYVNCAIQTTGYSGVVAKLSTGLSSPAFVTFEPTARTASTGPTASTHYPLEASTLFYVTGGQQPTITVTANDKLTGDQSCFVSGYFVTMP